MRSLTFHLIAHTHWDREWYLTRAGFLARLIPVLDEMLELLERRIGHDPETEIRIAADEQRKITRLRLMKLLDGRQE